MLEDVLAVMALPVLGLLAIPRSTYKDYYNLITAIPFKELDEVGVELVVKDLDIESVDKGD